MYGPADPKWGSWLDVPEWLLGCYETMHRRIQAEQTQQLMNAMLATNNRVLGDTERRSFMRELAATLAGEVQKRRAPKATAAFLRELRGVALRQPGAPRPARKRKT